MAFFIDVVFIHTPKFRGLPPLPAVPVIIVYSGLVVLKSCLNILQIKNKEMEITEYIFILNFFTIFKFQIL